MENKTNVRFRIDIETKECFAVFPNEKWSDDCDCTWFGKNEGHGGGNYSHIMKTSREAKPEEYENLKYQLEKGYNYNLNIIESFQIRFEKFTKDIQNVINEKIKTHGEESKFGYDKVIKLPDDFQYNIIDSSRWITEIKDSETFIDDYGNHYYLNSINFENLINIADYLDSL